jgi:hypothetical protein
LATPFSKTFDYYIAVKGLIEILLSFDTFPEMFDTSDTDENYD